MFLSSIWIQITIIGGVIVLFLVTYVLNKRTKAPKGIDLPEKCQTCEIGSCMIKTSDISKKKEELKDYLEKECKTNDEKKN